MAFRRFFRFHVLVNGKRTTVSLSHVLAELLTLQIGAEFGHESLSAWCQAEVDRDPNAFVTRASRRVADLACLAIARPPLVTRYYDRLDALLAAPRKKPQARS